MKVTNRGVNGCGRCHDCGGYLIRDRLSAFDHLEFCPNCLGYRHYCSHWDSRVCRVRWPKVQAITKVELSREVAT